MTPDQLHDALRSELPATAYVQVDTSIAGLYRLGRVSVLRSVDVTMEMNGRPVTVTAANCEQALERCRERIPYVRGLTQHIDLNAVLMGNGR